jgi:hypothetical protein
VNYFGGLGHGVIGDERSVLWVFLEIHLSTADSVAIPEIDVTVVNSSKVPSVCSARPNRSILGVSLVSPRQKRYLIPQFSLVLELFNTLFSIS